MSHEHDDAPQAVRTEALETLLVEKGLVDPVRVDEFINKYAEQTGPMNGSRMVARAWVDPDFKRRLLTNGKSAMDELGLAGAEAQQLDVVENSPSVHNVVVCTLCSCYPWAVLGLPPTWYKQPRLSFANCERAPQGPRGVWVYHLTRTSRSESGTRARKCVIWCYPKDRLAPRGWTRKGWRHW